MEDQLKIVDTSLFYSIVIIGAVMLSFRATLIQRQGIVDEKAYSVFPLRVVAGILTICALVWFWQYSADVLSKVEGPLAARSAKTNEIASGLVLVAAAVRLSDVFFTDRFSDDMLEEAILPY